MTLPTKILSLGDTLFRWRRTVFIALLYTLTFAIPARSEETQPTGILYNAAKTRHCSAFILTPEVFGMQLGRAPVPFKSSILATAAHCLKMAQIIAKEAITPINLLPNLGSTAPYFAVHNTEKLYFCLGGIQPNGECAVGEPIPLDPYLLVGTTGSQEGNDKRNDKSNDKKEDKSDPAQRRSMSADIAVLTADFSQLSSLNLQLPQSLHDLHVDTPSDFLSKFSELHVSVPPAFIKGDGLKKMPCPLIKREFATDDSTTSTVEPESLIRAGCTLLPGQSGAPLMARTADGEWGRIGIALGVDVNKPGESLFAPERRVISLAQKLYDYKTYWQADPPDNSSTDKGSFEFFSRQMASEIARSDSMAMSHISLEKSFKGFLDRQLYNIIRPEFKLNGDLTEDIDRPCWFHRLRDIKKDEKGKLRPEEIALLNSMDSDLYALNEATKDFSIVLSITLEIYKRTSAKADQFHLAPHDYSHITPSQFEEISRQSLNLLKEFHTWELKTNERRLSYLQDNPAILARYAHTQVATLKLDSLQFLETSESIYPFALILHPKEFKAQLEFFLDQTRGLKPLLQSSVSFTNLFENYRLGPQDFTFLIEPTGSDNGGGI